MDDATAILPDDPAALKAMVASLGAQIKSLESALSTRQLIIETLQLQLAALRRQTFGRKSEKVDAQIEQLELKLEEFQADEAEDPAPTTEVVKAARAKRARKPLPDHLPRDTVTYRAPSCDCPNCGGSLQPIGEDLAEQLEFIPASFRVIRHVRPKFGCTRCDTLVQAPAPSRPIERGIAADSTHACSITEFPHTPRWVSRLLRKAAIFSNRCISFQSLRVSVYNRC